MKRKRPSLCFPGIGAVFAFLPIAAVGGIDATLGGVVAMLGVFSLTLLGTALATARKRKVTYSAVLYDKDTFDRLFGEISCEDIEYYKDSLIRLFQLIRNICKNRAETFRSQGPGVSGKSVLRGIRLFFRTLFHRTAATMATNVDPMYLSTDVTGIVRAFRTENGFMYSCAKELAAGAERYLDLLGSPDPEKLKFAVQSGAAFYLEIRNGKDDLMDGSPCYAVQIAYFLCQYAKTFNRYFYDKMARYIGSGFHLSVDINIVREIFTLYDSRTAGK